MKYNLVDMPWIPVLLSDGSYRRLGIKEALCSAGHIREIASSNPMDRVALVRFLLAVLYWCRGNPPETYPDPAGSFPVAWFRKLDVQRECFNLLGKGSRFYQYAGEPSPKKLSANYLAQEIPTGRNFWHFRHVTEGEDGLCLACCALGLVRLPAFATSGGRGKQPGINRKPPLYVVPEGATLGMTLRLSWRPVSGDLGTPFWEKPTYSLPEQTPIPMLVGLTWVPRKVWLDDPAEPSRPCVLCGRTDLLIHTCVFAGIGKGSPRAWRDPQALYGRHEETPAQSPANALSSPGKAAAEWAAAMRGLLRNQHYLPALQEAIDRCGAEPSQIRLRIVGFSTERNDKYLETTERVLCVPDPSHQSAQAVRRLDSWLKEAERMRLALARAESPARDPKREKEIIAKSALFTIRPHVETLVAARARELVSDNQAAWQDAASEYRPMMRAVAASLTPGCTTAALTRRKMIEEVKPEVTSSAVTLPADAR